MPNRNSGLAELAQMMQLVNGGGQDNSAALQQQGALHWMQMQQAQQQHAAEQQWRQQQLAQTGAFQTGELGLRQAAIDQTREQHNAAQQYHEAALKQSIAHDLWQQQHAIAQETNADKRAQLAQEMEQDKAQMGLFHAALQGGLPYVKAVKFLPDRIQQSMLKQHQAELAQALPGVQSLVEGVYNSPDAGRKGVDPNMLAMTAIASAGFRPQDYMDKIDYSGMNPFPGYKPFGGNGFSGFGVPPNYDPTTGPDPEKTKLLLALREKNAQDEEAKQTRYRQQQAIDIQNAALKTEQRKAAGFWETLGNAFPSN